MYLYQKRDSLNLTLTQNNPVETPDVELKGYKNGVELLLDGAALNTVSDKEALEGAAQIVAFQRDSKLYVTFKGAEGIENPEVVIDEIEAGKVLVTVNGEAFNLVYTNDDVTVGDAVTTTEAEQPAPAKVDPIVEPEVTEPEDTELPEEEVEEE